MNDWRNNPAVKNGNGKPGNNAQTNQAATTLTDNLPNELIQFARNHFGANFSNPDRSDCPDRAKLDSLARSGHLPDDDLRTHLFGCSECFQQYRAALAESRQPSQAIPEASWLEKFNATIAELLRPKLAWAGATTAILIGFAIWSAWNAEPISPPVAMPETLQAQSPTPSSVESKPTPIVETAINANASKTVPSASANDAVVFSDLNQYVAMRSAANAASPAPQAITLRPERTRLKLTLPEGSLAGNYTVKLLDQSGKTIASKAAVSRDGKKLIVILNLKNVGLKNYTLSLQRQGEWAEAYPVIVAKP
ncbi:MAG: hypothetical protein ACKVZH_28945 [Blastocatellia bacterium]